MPLEEDPPFPLREEVSSPLQEFSAYPLSCNKSQDDGLVCWLEGLFEIYEYSRRFRGTGLSKKGGETLGST